MVREIPLASRKHPGLVALVDDEDYDRVAAIRWRAEKPQRSKTPYAVARRRRKEGGHRSLLLHRLVLGVSAPLQVDHVNGDGLDCRKENLRPATGSQNQANRPAQRNNTSGFKGVYGRGSGRWRALIGFQGRLRTIGTFATPEEAARAYDATARELFGDFAHCNFPAA